MKKYFSKILLFGEYGIISNSNALAIPYDEYSGQIMFDDNDLSSNKNLHKLYEFLIEKKLDKILDTSSFEKDLNKGMIFKSNIPVQVKRYFRDKSSNVKPVFLFFANAVSIRFIFWPAL